MAKFDEDGAAELYYDGTKKFETTSAGVKISGSGTDAIEMTGDVWFNNNEHAGADIYFNSGSKHLIFEDSVTAKFGGGGDLQIYHDGSHNYFDNLNGTLKIRLAGNADFIELQQDRDVWIKGNPKPWDNNTYDLGTSSYRWRNIYTNDLNLSNEGSSNDFDGSWGDWTIQEGESDLFLKNNRSGKKYKFNLTEVL